MITAAKTVTGGITVSALVVDRETSFAYYDWMTYYGYGIREAKKLFREYLAETGKKLVK